MKNTNTSKTSSNVEKSKNIDKQVNNKENIGPKEKEIGECSHVTNSSYFFLLKKGMSLNSKRSNSLVASQSRNTERTSRISMSNVLNQVSISNSSSRKAFVF